MENSPGQELTGNATHALWVTEPGTGRSLRKGPTGQPNPPSDPAKRATYVARSRISRIWAVSAAGVNGFSINRLPGLSSPFRSELSPEKPDMNRTLRSGSRTLGANR